MNYKEEMELMHFGKLGMKWGVRKSTYRSRLETKYKSKGLNSEEAKLKADKLIKVQVGVGVGVGVTAIAIGAYYAKKYLDANGSKTLKVGTEFQHVAKILNEDFSKPVYVSYLKSDNKTYKNFYQDVGAPYIKKLKATKDIKIAGKKEVINAFKEWTASNKVVSSGNTDYTKLVKNQGTKSAYRSFNSLLVSPDYRDRKIRDSFFDFLESKGFSAIHDTHDQDGFRGGVKAPLILFGKNSPLMLMEVSDMVRTEANASAYDYYKNLKEGW